MKTYTIYSHITPSNKAYIGITKLNPKRRWNSGHGYRNNNYFQNAIDKYGWDNIEHIVMATGLTEEQAYRCEKLLISIFKTNERTYGYNIELGGKGGSHPPDVRKRISDKVKGSLNGMYGVSRIGKDAPMYGIPSPMKGKKHTKESRDKMSVSAIRRYTESMHPSARKVICVTTGEIFDTMKDGAEKYNIHSSNICNNCKGRAKSAGRLNGEKLVWRYYDDL